MQNRCVQNTDVREGTVLQCTFLLSGDQWVLDVEVVSVRLESILFGRVWDWLSVIPKKEKFQILPRKYFYKRKTLKFPCLTVSKHGTDSGLSQEKVNCGIA